MNATFDIARLITKSLKNELDKEETEILNQWLAEEKANQELFNRLSSDQNLLARLDSYHQFDASGVWKRVEEEITETKVIELRANKYLRYAASLLLPLLLSVGVMYFFLWRTPEDRLAGIDKKIVPGVEKATLTLSDGSHVELEKVKGLQTQGKAKIRKLDHSLVYSVEDEEKKELIYNELETPYGGQYQVQLADGTRVTLNAGSSLRYPVSFDDSTRTVYLSGEAYFDVTSTGKPFIVSSDQQNIRVLGTQFNVNAYEDEVHISTTLVEGSVQITSSNNQIVLVPGTQAQLDRTTELLQTESVNTMKYTSWMQGKLEFNNDTMEGVVKRLARWYNFNYEFQNEKAKDYHFSGSVDSNQPISSILQMLEASADLRFELDGETIVIQ